MTLVHDHFGVDETIVIDVVFEHVPRVRVAIERVMRELELSGSEERQRPACPGALALEGRRAAHTSFGTTQE